MSWFGAFGSGPAPDKVHGWGVGMVEAQTCKDSL